MFWADEIAEALKEKKGNLLVDDMVTPSGNPHAGTLRGAVIHDVAAKALRTAGRKARFTFVCNDMDPFDKIPAYLDKKEYAQYMGMPMMNVPAPDGDGNYAAYYIEMIYQEFGGGDYGAVAARLRAHRAGRPSSAGPSAPGWVVSQRRP